MPHLTRRRSLAALAAAAAATTSTRAQSPRNRPNLLYILADDHAAYVQGADGNRLARTPNLDRLAAEGTRFSANYCNSPVCTPSRQSFLTGQMPYAAGVTRLATPLDESKPTIARQLKAAGYATGVIGKMHFNTPGRAGLHGFDYCVTERELQAAWMRDVNPAPLPEGTRTKPPWRPFQDPARVWLNAEKLPYPRREAGMKAAYQLRLADQFLEAHRAKPFALWVSFHEPHSPYDFPFEDQALFEPSQFEVPRTGPEDAWQVPKIFRDFTPQDKQGIQAAYYTSVTYLDRNIGRLLESLRKHHLDDNTLIVYMADHGYCLGQHGRFEKHCGYDPALRVPLILRWPGHVRARATVSDFTESIDVPPTILDLLNADPLPVQHGSSLRAYAEGKRPSRARNHIVSVYHENEEAFCRTSRWKFIYCSGKRARKDGYDIDNPTPGRYKRLYDLKSDPGEFTDVAAKHPKIVSQLENEILARLHATHPDKEKEPHNISPEDALDFYLKPRDPDPGANPRA